jgi:3-phenylpropionate/cinnamic acid dioxygenase small subunit
VNDRSDISDLLVRYATALDTRDWDLLHSCFTEDAVVDFDRLGGRKDGWAAIRGAVGLVTGFDRTQHFLGNMTITIDNDEAQASTYVQAHHVIDGDLFTVAGAYHDQIVRTPAGWRIAYRRLEPVWQSGNSELSAVAAARSAD